MAADRLQAARLAGETRRAPELPLPFETDPAGFPMVWVEPIAAWMDWLPVSKLHFERCLLQAPDRPFDAAWYERLLAQMLLRRGVLEWAEQPGSPAGSRRPLIAAGTPPRSATGRSAREIHRKRPSNAPSGFRRVLPRGSRGPVERDLQVDDLAAQLGRVLLAVEIRVVPPDPHIVVDQAGLARVGLAEDAFYLGLRLAGDARLDLIEGQSRPRWTRSVRAAPDPTGANRRGEASDSHGSPD
jgi:hypothetical protein